MIKPGIEEIRKIANTGNYSIAPVSMELLADIKTPIEVLKTLMHESKHCYMLESVVDSEKWGRYTFLGFSPKLEITCANGNMTIGSSTFQTSDPGKQIRQVLQSYRSPVIDGSPPFTGSLVG